MKRAFAVIGANFGDEGKGLMTEKYCREHPGALDIRFNGGAQAGHTVCTPDGKRHVFSHIGAGHFAGADTFLSEFFTVNPMLFMREANTLDMNGIKVFVDYRCPVTLPCDMLLNQFAERKRGAERHGSCGVGIFETEVRSSKKCYRIRYGDIHPGNGSTFRKLVDTINREWVPARAAELGITGSDLEELMDIVNNGILNENYLFDVMEMKSLCTDSDEGIIEEYGIAVFEGAQGLLLDRDRDDYFPHLTPSNTGMKNVRHILDRLEERETEICYVTRTYFTRHGAGRFNTEDIGIEEEYGLYDNTNAPNEFQGVFRYGWFDMPEFFHTLDRERRYHRPEDKIAIAVTHLDMTDGKIITPTGTLRAENIAVMGKADILYTSWGETANDVMTAECALCR